MSTPNATLVPAVLMKAHVDASSPKPAFDQLEISFISSYTRLIKILNLPYIKQSLPCTKPKPTSYNNINLPRQHAIYFISTLDLPDSKRKPTFHQPA